MVPRQQLLADDEGRAVRLVPANLHFERGPGNLGLLFRVRRFREEGGSLLNAGQKATEGPEDLRDRGNHQAHLTEREDVLERVQLTAGPKEGGRRDREEGERPQDPQEHGRLLHRAQPPKRG